MYCSKSPQRSRPCMLHNFRFQSVIVIVNCSLYWMPHTHTKWQTQNSKKMQKPLALLSDLLELPSKKQKVFVSCKGATAGSPQYVSTHFLPRSLNALEILTVNFWISFFGCFSNFKACLILIILFVGGVSGHSSPVKALTDWNGSCSIPLSVMLLKQLATASQRQMQSCKTPMLTDHSQRLRNMPHLYTFVEYHHLNMRISTCHVCLPYNWFVCHSIPTHALCAEASRSWGISTTVTSFPQCHRRWNLLPCHHQI